MLFAILIYLVIGAVAGFLAGLFGIGGGIILVPGFYYTLSWMYPEASSLMQVSLGTALATIVITGVSSVRAHAVRGNVHVDILKRLAPGIVIGAACSAIIADALDSSFLKTFFAFMIMGLACLMLIGPEKFRKASHYPPMIVSNIGGAVIGCLSGLLGIGGATLSVPYMSFFKTEIRAAVGTASALGLFISVPSAIGFIVTGWGEETGIPYMLGYIFWPAWLAVVSMTSFTAIYGARLAHDLNPIKLKRIFALFMVVIAVMMIGDEFFSPF